MVLENSSSFRNTHIGPSGTNTIHIFPVLVLDVNVNSTEPKFSSPLGSKILPAELKLLRDVVLSER